MQANFVPRPEFPFSPAQSWVGHRRRERRTPASPKVIVVCRCIPHDSADRARREAAKDWGQVYLAGFRTHYTVINAKLDALILGNMSRSYGGGARCREDEMQPGRSPVPPIVALIVAIVGSIVLFSMDFDHAAVRDDGIQKISREALTRAQATATPTLPPGDY
jgi:hypothetical protein